MKYKKKWNTRKDFKKKTCFRMKLLKKGLLIDSRYTEEHKIKRRKNLNHTNMGRLDLTTQRLIIKNIVFYEASIELIIS